MRPPRNVLVVGAGLAGLRVAETLRAEGYDGDLVVVGDEPVAPYERPTLSKELLRGAREPGEITLRGADAYAELGIELVLGRRAMRLDRRSTVLDDGRRLPWDALVLATGARARPLPGPVPEGVHRLRTLADALALREELIPGRRLAVIGAGLVGSEVASTARAMGVEVVLLDAALPLEAALGPEVGSILAARQRAHGVDFRLGARATGFRASANGRVSGVLLDDGTEVGCHVALVAIGATPATDLIATPRGRGIPTDACGRTAVPGIYAAGDAALPFNAWLGAAAAIDHWTAAAGLAAAAARAVLGCEAPYCEPPSFWSDQLGLRLQFVGRPGPWARTELEGYSDNFEARYFDQRGVQVAGTFAGRPTEFALLRRRLSLAHLALAA